MSAVVFDIGKTKTVVFTAVSITTAAFTLPATSNRVAVCGMYMVGTGATGLNATVGGVTPGTAVAGTDSTTAQSSRTLLWQVIAPATGSQTASMGWTGSFEAGMTCAVFSNVDQTTPCPGGTFTSNTTGAVSLTPSGSSAGDVGVAFYATHGSVSGRTQTLVDVAVSAGGTCDGEMNRSTTNGATFAWADSAAIWTASACNIAHVVGTAALTGTATATITEANVVAGGKTIITTLTNDTFVPASGFATIALRGTGKSGNTTNGGNVTLTFDVGGNAPQTGDVVIVFGGHGTTVTTLADPTGYTQIGVHTGTAPIFGAWYKVMGGTPDTTVVGSGGGNAADAVAYACWVIDGSTLDASIFDATTTTAGPTTSTNPNCASITTATAGAWVLALAGSVVNDASPGTVSGYTNQVNSNATDTSPFTTSGMTKLVSAAGAEDPAAYSSWSSGAWYGITVALKPKATTPFDSARQAFINGFDSAQAEATGWDAVVKGTEAVSAIVRTSSTVVTWTLSAFASYNITAQETITGTIPASMLAGGAAITATPTFTVDASAGGVTTGVGSATGTSTVPGVGRSTWRAAGSSTGTSTAPGVGKATFRGVGNSTGTSTVPGVGRSTWRAAGAATGISTAPGAGRSTWRGVGSAAGTSTAPGVGRNAASGTVTGTGSATGTSTALGVGKSTFRGVGTAAGTSTALAVGRDASATYVWDTSQGRAGAYKGRFKSIQDVDQKALAPGVSSGATLARAYVEGVRPAKVRAPHVQVPPLAVIDAVVRPTIVAVPAAFGVEIGVRAVLPAFGSVAAISIFNPVRTESAVPAVMTDAAIVARAACLATGALPPAALGIKNLSDEQTIAAALSMLRKRLH